MARNCSKNKNHPWRDTVVCFAVFVSIFGNVHNVKPPVSEFLRNLILTVEKCNFCPTTTCNKVRSHKQSKSCVDTLQTRYFWIPKSVFDLVDPTVALSPQDLLLCRMTKLDEVTRVVQVEVAQFVTSL